MKAVPRSQRLAALLTLPLAILSAAPSIQFCSLRWCEVTPEVLLDCGVAGAAACRARHAQRDAEPACAARDDAGACGVEAGCAAPAGGEDPAASGGCAARPAGTQ